MQEQTEPRKYRMERYFKLYPGRKYLKVAEYLGREKRDDDLTVRWFKNMETGEWFVAESWKRPNLRKPLNAEQTAYVESVL